MTRYAALLRGINVSGRNMISMPLLREIAEAAGFADVATYLQSGNLFVTTSQRAATVASTVRAAVGDRTGLDVPVVVRSHAELTRVVAANPLGEPADPKRFYVTFLDGRAGLGLDAGAYGEEKAVAHGCEIYSWYPAGMNASKLAPALARKGGKDGTARNWNTVLALVDQTG